MRQPTLIASVRGTYPSLNGFYRVKVLFENKNRMDFYMTAEGKLSFPGKQQPESLLHPVAAEKEFQWTKKWQETNPDVKFDEELNGDLRIKATRLCRDLQGPTAALLIAEAMRVKEATASSKLGDHSEGVLKVVKRQLIKAEKADVVTTKAPAEEVSTTPPTLEEAAIPASEAPLEEVIVEAQPVTGMIAKFNDRYKNWQANRPGRKKVVNG